MYVTIQRVVSAAPRPAPKLVVCLLPEQGPVSRGNVRLWLPGLPIGGSSQKRPSHYIYFFRPSGQ